MEAFSGLPRYAFKRTMIEYAPEEPGVYGLFDGPELIWIGRAKGTPCGIKAMLLQHQDGVFGDCTMKATMYSWEIDLWASARETEILASFTSKYGRDPRCMNRTKAA